MYVKKMPAVCLIWQQMAPHEQLLMVRTGRNTLDQTRSSLFYHLCSYVTCQKTLLVSMWLSWLNVLWSKRELSAIICVNSVWKIFQKRLKTTSLMHLLVFTCVRSWWAVCNLLLVWGLSITSFPAHFLLPASPCHSLSLSLSPKEYVGVFFL